MKVEIIPGQRYLFHSPYLTMVVEASSSASETWFECKALLILSSTYNGYKVGQQYSLLGPNREGNWTLLSNQNSPQC
jgi:hypothetical protein